MHAVGMSFAILISPILIGLQVLLYWEIRILIFHIKTINKVYSSIIVFIFSILIGYIFFPAFYTNTATAAHGEMINEGIKVLHNYSFLWMGKIIIAVSLVSWISIMFKRHFIAKYIWVTLLMIVAFPNLPSFLIGNIRLPIDNEADTLNIFYYGWTWWYEIVSDLGFDNADTKQALFSPSLRGNSYFFLSLLYSSAVAIAALPHVLALRDAQTRS